jgi:hypothetical protein
LIGVRFNNKLQLARSFVDAGGRRGMKYMLARGRLGASSAA